jgi:hypothetical protein
MERFVRHNNGHATVGEPEAWIPAFAGMTRSGECRKHFEGVTPAQAWAYGVQSRRPPRKRGSIAGKVDSRLRGNDGQWGVTEALGHVTPHATPLPPRRRGSIAGKVDSRSPASAEDKLRGNDVN